MRKYYTRACNFCYGETARNLILNNKALPLNSRQNIAFDQIEIFQRKQNQVVESKFCSIKEIKNLDKEILLEIEKDIKNITLERKSILGLKFDTPQIIGVLNITPDSFSDGGLFFEETKAYEQAKLMVDSGATIIDIGGESTRPGSKTVDEKEEWNKKKNIIVKSNIKQPVHLGLYTQNDTHLKQVSNPEKNGISKQNLEFFLEILPH